MVLELRGSCLKMLTSLILMLWMMLLLHQRGVFGDEVKVVPVMEGHSVTLTADGTERQGYDELEWVLAGALIAKINMKNKQISFNETLNKRFRDRLQLNNQTGSLTIINTTITDSGPYRLEMKGTNLKSKIFNVTVYAPVPTPVIISYCPSSSSSSKQNCSFLCSVMDVTRVTLSWYKENSLLSSISVSDLSISVSLHLGVEYQDKNTYSCVMNNPISNQSQHLKISELCHTCEAQQSELCKTSQNEFSNILIFAGAAVTFLVMVTIVITCIYRNLKKAGQQVETVHTCEEEIMHADPTFCKQKARVQKEDVVYVVYAGVAVSR
ncbi:SLAM family member 9 isoform X1 [Labeo rohita]|uniref:SLAM family member 9 isoform X1 n=1 Tax=Labeo rohita TaxID=84645 RepID=UPI0021E1C32B|nr:SLAM family member 9 isoform X1 [Labeo rohita]